GRSSAACTTTTRATRPATRFVSPATRPAPTPTRTRTPAAAPSWPSSSATRRRTCPRTSWCRAWCPAPARRTSAWRTSRSRPAPRGAPHRPWEAGAAPAAPGPFRVPNFGLPQGVTLERVGERRQLLDSFDRVRREVDATGQMDALDRFGRRAWDILTSPAAREAFDLDREPPAVRERYGFMPPFDPKAANRCGAPACIHRILLA